MSTVILWVDIPATEVLTSNQRLHWGERARRTRALRWRATLAYRAAGKPRMEAAHLTARLTYRDRRRRDAHNIMPTLKACVDGVVAAGLLPDDDDTHLTGPDLRVAEPDREKKRRGGEDKDIHDNKRKVRDETCSFLFHNAPHL